jgi:prepilin-type processing-associated H-X9-DG protein
METKRRRFWLTDLIAVVLVLFLAFMVATPWISRQWDGTEQMRCESAQREVAKAIGLFVTSKQFYPGYCEPVSMSVRKDGKSRQKVLKSWIVAVMEELDEKTYDAIRKDIDPQRIGMRYFQCPLNRRGGEWINYVANCGRQDALGDVKTLPLDWKANGVFMRPELSAGAGVLTETVRITDIIDGEAYTLLISENLQATRWTSIDEAGIGMVWYPESDAEHPHPPTRAINVGRDLKLDRPDYDYARPSSQHPGGVVVAYCDGHTDFITDDIDYRVYCALMTSDGANAREPGSDLPVDETYRH